METEQSTAVAVVRERAATGVVEWTPEQVQLIRDTVAKGATDNEFKLFLYRCQNMGLDPLKPGMIHFVKFNNNPGTMIVGIDGFRSRAGRTGKHAGTRRGVLRDDKGKCVGAWAEVYRTDWTHPAREEVSLAEYNSGKAQWGKMPETMIKKVAEAASLRMAFPDELGGVYTREEMHQAEPMEGEVSEASTVNETKFPPPPRDFGACEITQDDHRALVRLGRDAKWTASQLMEYIFKNFAKREVSKLSRYEYDKTFEHIADNPVIETPEEVAANAMDAKNGGNGATEARA